MTNGQDINKAVIPLVQTVFLSKDVMGVKEIEQFTARAFLDDTIRHSDSIWLNGRYEIHLDYYGIEGKKLYRNRVSLPLKVEMPSDWRQTNENKIDLHIKSHKLDVLAPYVLEFSGDIIAENLIYEKENQQNKKSDDRELVKKVSNEDEQVFAVSETAEYVPDEMVKEVLAGYTAVLPKDKEVAGVESVKVPKPHFAAGNKQEAKTKQTDETKTYIKESALSAAEKKTAKQQSVVKNTEPVKKPQESVKITDEKTADNQQKKQVKQKNLSKQAEKSTVLENISSAQKDIGKKVLTVINQKKAAEEDVASTYNTGEQEAADQDIKSLKNRALHKLKKRSQTAEMKNKNFQTAETTAAEKPAVSEDVKKAVSVQDLLQPVSVKAAEKASAEMQVDDTKAFIEENKNQAAAKAENNEAAEAVNEKTEAVVVKDIAVVTGDTAEAEVMDIKAEAAILTAEETVVSDDLKLDLRPDLENVSDELAQILDNTNEQFFDEEQISADTESEDISVDTNRIVAASGLVANLQMVNAQKTDFWQELSGQENGYFVIKYAKVQTEGNDLWQKTEQ